MFNVNVASSTEKIILDLIQKKETIALKSIEKLINDGILVVKESPMALFKDPSRDDYQLGFTFSLECKEQDIINKLKEENRLLNEKLEKLKELFNG